MLVYEARTRGSEDATRRRGMGRVVVFGGNDGSESRRRQASESERSRGAERRSSRESFWIRTSKEVEPRASGAICVGSEGEEAERDVLQMMVEDGAVWLRDADSIWSGSRANEQYLAVNAQFCVRP